MYDNSVKEFHSYAEHYHRISLVKEVFTKYLTQNIFLEETIFHKTIFEIKCQEKDVTTCTKI